MLALEMTASIANHSLFIKDEALPVYAEYARIIVLWETPKSVTQPRLGDLAVRLFGVMDGIDLDLPQHPPHEPLEFGRDFT